MRKRISLAVVLMLAGTAGAQTLPDGWTYRRALTFRPLTSDAPGDNIAWAEFYANGTQKADGSDVRVTTADRTLVAHKLLQISAENDLVRIAFATRGEGPYYVWWGNSRADVPASPVKELEIRRGIFLEISPIEGPGGFYPIDSPHGKPRAAFIMPELNLGFNPAGDERHSFMQYRAQFKIDREITPLLAFTVNEHGRLVIDGKEIAASKNYGLQGAVRESFPVTLAAGWHALEITQTNQAHVNPVMALAWQRPGEKAFTPLPGNLFAPAARAGAGLLEKIGASGGGAGGAGGAVDFTVDPTAEGFLPPSFYGQRYTFEAQFPATLRPRISWDFGDGQTNAGLRKVSHMYLAPGHYPVTLKLDNGGPEPLTATIRLPVRPRMYERFPRPVEDNVQTVRALLQDYKLEKMPADQSFRGMMFFESVADIDGQINWGRAWIAGNEMPPPADSVVLEESAALARLLCQQKKYKEAAAIFRQAAAKNIGVAARTHLMRLEVITLCDQADDPSAALTEAREWQNKFPAPQANKEMIQAHQAALAYALIGTGDGKAAKVAIDAAIDAAPPAPTAEALNRQSIRQGTFTRNLENYIREKDFATATKLLNQWEFEFPAAIWEGFTRTLRVKLLAAQGEHGAAARTGVALTRANPGCIYAAELLYRAAENFRIAGEEVQAVAALDLLKSKYPESPYARDAAK